MFARVPVLNDSAESEMRLMRVDAVEEVKPHDDVTVGMAEGVDCCTVRFRSGTEIIVLLTFGTMQEHLAALQGIITEFGELT